MFINCIYEKKKVDEVYKKGKKKEWRWCYVADNVALKQSAEKKNV